MSRDIPGRKRTPKLNKLTIKRDRPQLSPEDVRKLQAAMTEKAKRDQTGSAPVGTGALEACGCDRGRRRRLRAAGVRTGSPNPATA